MVVSPKLVAALVLLVITFASGFGLRHWIDTKEDLEAALQDAVDDKAELAQYIEKADANRAENQILQTQLRTLEVQQTRNLNEQLAENSRLRADLGVAQRMQLKGARCVPGPSTAGSEPAGGLGDGATVELGGETRQLVFDLRADISTDQAKLRYLQNYLRERGIVLPAK